MATKKESNMPPTEARVSDFTSQQGTRQVKSNKKVLVLAVIILLVLIGAFIYYLSVQHKHKEAAAKLPYLTQTQRSQYLADQGDYKGAQQALQDQLSSSKTTSAKLGIYYQQSALALRFKHYTDAAKYAQEAKQLAPNSPASYVALARLSQAQGNKPAAKQYWQQAINHLDPNSPTYNLTKRDYQSSLDGVQ